MRPHQSNAKGFPNASRSFASAPPSYGHLLLILPRASAPVHGSLQLQEAQLTVTAGGKGTCGPKVIRGALDAPGIKPDNYELRVKIWSRGKKYHRRR